MTPSGYLFLGLTALVAALVAVLIFAVLRFAAAARETKQIRTGTTAEAVLLSSAMQDAVSSLKAREQAMSARAVASEQLASQVFDSLTAGLIVVSPDGRIQIANPAACEMLSAPASVVDMDFRSWLGSSPMAAAIEDGLGSGRAIARRVVHTLTADEGRHFGVTVSPLGHASGGAICLFSDLTTVVELEQQLQMKEALARLGEMTAGIAHEFRNGLATIHGYSRLFDLQSLPAPYPAYVEGIRQEADALGHVVTNFLNFARPEQLLMSPVDLEAAATRVVDELRRELHPDAAIIVEGAFGSIQGDEVLLRQVFGNLVRNAAEACETAGRVPKIVIRGECSGDQQLATVSIGDNGPGIPAEHRERVFQPFFTTRSRGSGLGLAIVQKLVLLHNGKVAIDSSPEGGAEFHLTFPVAA